MVKFSDRVGITQPPTELQVNSMNAELRNSMWNALVQVLETGDLHWRRVVTHLFIYFFKEPVDNMRSTIRFCRDDLRERFMECEWYDVYNIIEELLPNIEEITSYNIMKEEFEILLNYVLKRELSGYRIIKGKLVPITDEREIQTIREATSTSSSLGLNGVNQHITNSLRLLGKKPDPDYLNSIKESISAVESICELLTGEKAFGKALKKLSGKLSLHGAIEKGFLSLYGYTSDEDGIRHAILELKDVGFAEAKFMLVTCSAFVNFVIDKARQAKMF